MAATVACERCARQVSRLKQINIGFPTMLLPSFGYGDAWHEALSYSLCSDCAHEMRRKLLDTAIRVINKCSTHRDRKELPR